MKLKMEKKMLILVSCKYSYFKPISNTWDFEVNVSLL
jgi:hypothetical protein